MRRMRPFSKPFLKYAAIAVPAVGLIYGATALFSSHKVSTPDPTIDAKKEDRSESVAKAKMKSLVPTEVDLSGDEPVCLSSEYPGQGTAQIHLNAADWQKVMDTYHEAKRDIASWLSNYETQLGAENFAKMQEQVKDLKIKRPPVTDEPDLDWRGVGVFSRDIDHEPLVKVGSGFVELVKKDVKRAKFELARLIAQSISSCELAELGVSEAHDPWKPMLDCLKLEVGSQCKQHETSEAAWAVSTAVAAVVAPPGCRVPAFNDRKIASCIVRPMAPVSAWNSEGESHE